MLRGANSILSNSGTGPAIPLVSIYMHGGLLESQSTDNEKDCAMTLEVKFTTKLTLLG